MTARQRRLADAARRGWVLPHEPAAFAAGGAAEAKLTSELVKAARSYLDHGPDTTGPEQEVLEIALEKAVSDLEVHP